MLPKNFHAHFSPYFVIVLVDHGHGHLFAERRVVVDVGRRQIGVAAVIHRSWPRGRRRQPLSSRPPLRRCALRLDELPGKLDAPSDVVVASAPLERAIRAVRMRSAPTTEQRAGRAVPGHGVRERGRAECVHERLFFGTCTDMSRVLSTIEPWNHNGP